LTPKNQMKAILGSVKALPFYFWRRYDWFYYLCSNKSI